MTAPIYQYQGAKGLKAISQLTGIPKPTLSSRIRNFGLTVEQAVHYKSTHGETYELNGVFGLKNIAQAHGMNYSTLRHRLVKMNMPIEEAVKKDPLYNNRKPIERKPKQEQQGLLTELHPLWALALGIKKPH